MVKRSKTNKVCCSDCIHYHACSMWNVGTLYHTDASTCYNFDTYENFISFWKPIIKEGD